MREDLTNETLSGKVNPVTLSNKVEMMNATSPDTLIPSEASQAAEELARLDAYRRAGHRAAAAVWFPLLVGGIATLAAPGAYVAIGTANAPMWYWMFAGPGIGIACAVFYASRRIQLPRPSGALSVGVAVAMIAGTLGIAAVLGAVADNGAPELVVAVGLAMFAWSYRSILVAIVAVAGLGTAAVMLATDDPQIQAAATLAMGAVACVCAVVALLTPSAGAGMGAIDYHDA